MAGKIASARPHRVTCWKERAYGRAWRGADSRGQERPRCGSSQSHVERNTVDAKRPHSAGAAHAMIATNSGARRLRLGRGSRSRRRGRGGRRPPALRLLPRLESRVTCRARFERPGADAETAIGAHHRARCLLLLPGVRHRLRGVARAGEQLRAAVRARVGKLRREGRA